MTLTTAQELLIRQLNANLERYFRMQKTDQPKQWLSIKDAVALFDIGEKRLRREMKGFHSDDLKYRKAAKGKKEGYEKQYISLSALEKRYAKRNRIIELKTA